MLIVGAIDYLSKQFIFDVVDATVSPRGIVRVDMSPPLALAYDYKAVYEQ
jgi:hypothetical protein